VLGARSLCVVTKLCSTVQENAELAVREMLKDLSLRHNLKAVDSLYASDSMDDGATIRLKLTIDREHGTAVFDFTGTDPEIYGNINAPRAVTTSAIIYCLRCLVKRVVPLNQGCLNPISIIIPDGTFLSPSDTAAVVGGNVLTSQRVTDVILHGFQAVANSQGCMNNFTFGDETMGYCTYLLILRPLNIH
jgi:5-oxoprolinase (ATP-hydrolysing)